MVGNQSLEQIWKNPDCFRFTVLHHELPAVSGRRSHWDLLLERPQEGLLTFEVPSPPSDWDNPILVQQLPVHRLLYLDYEGPVPGDRGHVTRVLDGFVCWQERSESRLRATLHFTKVLAYAGHEPTMRSELKITKMTDSSCDVRWELRLKFV